jgi:HlyD family secretion protein
MKIPILPLLAVTALAWAGYSVVQSQPERLITTPPIEPPRSAFAATVAAVGLVEPSSEAISIGSPRAAVVDVVYVKVGDEVKKDQPMVKLRTREMEAERLVAVAAIAEAEAQIQVANQQVKVAEAQVQIAQAELAQSRRLLDFATQLKDSRVISEEERTQRAMTVATHEARLLSASAHVAASLSSVSSAKTAHQSAKAKLDVIDVDLDRSIIKAPMDATVLQVRVRAGEHISAPSSSAWLTIGQTHPLHVRADVDEHEAWRVKPGAKAEAQVRGNPSLKATLTFVRFEPMVIPKQSLTGDATERVDTRVLQVIYRIDDASKSPLFVGQQMDVFIDTSTDVAAR